MASETFAGLTAALSSTFSARVQDIVNRRTNALGYINIVQNDSGQVPRWDAKFTGSKATTVFAAGADVDASEYNPNPKVPASLAWGNYRCPVKIDDLAAILAAVAKGSPAELERLIESNVMDSIKTLTKRVNYDVLRGTGTSGGNPNIIGLFGGSTADTGIYANINRSTYPEWEGQVLANGGVPRPLTDNLLRQAEQAVFDAGKGPPDIMITTGGVHRKYAALFTPIQRVQTAGQAPAVLGGGTMELLWGNMPLIRDSDAPTGKLIMFPRDMVELVFPGELLPLLGMGMDGRLPQAQRNATNGTNTFVFPIVVEILARAGNSVPINVWTHLQLKVKDPSACAVIEDISES